MWSDLTTKERVKWTIVIAFGLVAGVIGASMAVVITDALGFTSNVSSSGIEGTTKEIQLTYKEYKSTIVDVSYNQLIRNPSIHIDKRMCFRGQVVQRIEDGEDRTNLRVATKKEILFNEEYYAEDIIYLTVYQDFGERLIEKDLIEFCGKFIGLKSYNTILGAQITIPQMNTLKDYIERDCDVSEEC